MLSTLETVLLGVVQGLTEFLPVSSSGHLVLFQHLFGLEEGSLTLDICLHAATFLAILTVLRTQVWELLKSLKRLPAFFVSLFQKGHLAISDDPVAWTVVLILASTVITGTIGFAFHDFFQKAFTSIAVLPITLTVTGGLLFATRFTPGKTGKLAQNLTLKDACWIGFAQAIALFPGISRSGATISTGLFLGCQRKFAGEYAFLVSLPAVFGAVVLEAVSGRETISIEGYALVLGFFSAYVVGVFSLRLFLHWVQKGKLSHFSIYCWALAALTLFLWLRS